MRQFNFSSVFKFLIGIFLAQAATVILVMAAARTHLEETWIIFALLALMTGFVTALWFASIASHVEKDAVARAKDDFSREREKIRVRAEKEKNKVIKQSHQQIIKETSRVQAKASFKVGAAFVGLLGLGALMLFTQFVTVGLLTLSTAGGALVGYLVRARQDYLNRKQNKAQQAVSKTKPVNIVEARPAQPRIESKSN